MSIVSFSFFVFIGIFLVIYYTIPKKTQWICLLVMSILFYYVNAKDYILWILFTILGTYFFANVIEYLQNKDCSSKVIKTLLVLNVLLALTPLMLLKYVIGSMYVSIGLPMGISFYTLQLIGYSVDVYRGKCKAENNLLKYMLFTMFFPHILQGPIARYGELSESLYRPHAFDENKIIKGFMLGIWGLFLKLVLADQAAVIVNTVFNDYKTHTGVYILVASVLYSIQLYADFMGCVSIAQGVSYMFGVDLAENFKHPYFSVSIKDFWRRWHMSLSSWFRDYVYIPLGGNRKGNVRKYINLMVTFLISGVWHGVGLQFIVWGLLHGSYQVVGDLTKNIREKAKELFHVGGTILDSVGKRIVTFVLVMLAWIFFRATSVRQAVEMIVLMVKDFSIQDINWRLFELGLAKPECIVLAISVAVLFLVSLLQERMCIREWVLKCPVVFRYTIYVVAICCILVFGRYGAGYNAGAFIYGGF